MNLFSEPFPTPLRRIAGTLHLSIQVKPPRPAADGGKPTQSVLVGVSLPSMGYVPAVLRRGTVDDLPTLIPACLEDFAERLLAAKTRPDRGSGVRSEAARPPESTDDTVRAERPEPEEVTSADATTVPEIRLDASAETDLSSDAPPISGSSSTNSRPGPATLARSLFDND